MSSAERPACPDVRASGPDRSALLLMLCYIEGECRRLGALEAARHVALAASLMPEVVAVPAPGLIAGPPPDAQLH